MLYNQDRKEKVAEIMDIIQANDVKYVLLTFVSIEGTQKSIGVNVDHLEDIIYHGEGFDGSSVTGYGQLEESDMVAVPDLDTWSLIPWRKEGEIDGRFICDIYRPNGERFEGDPRYVLQKVLKRAENMGFKFFLAPELEFFILKDENQHEPPKMVNFRGYFSSDDNEVDHLIRRDIAIKAEQFPNIKVETVHHEVAPSQHEISMKYAEALKMADATITMKMVVKMVSALHGYMATFMPKPWAGQNGSGMHVHQSLWDIKKNCNAFYDENDPNFISDTMRYFIGGQLKHAHSMTAILNSWPNSYKRLVPHYEAPTLIAWGFKNRSMLIRVPNFFGKGNAARCEIRSPDPAGNPYLQFAVLLNAGLDGIENKITPPAPVDINLFHLDADELKKRGIQNLPESLGEALSHMRKSEFTRNMLGSAFEAFHDSRMQENQLYNTQVSGWELSRYSREL